MHHRRLILIRHAHRDILENRLFDNGLSEKGFRQAHAIADFASKVIDLSLPVSIYASPKLRCIQTLQPMADVLNITIEVDNELVEMMPYESSFEFSQRIKSYGQSLLESVEGTVVLCSHGDWIPAFIEVFYGKSFTCKKGSWTDFEVRRATGLNLYECRQRWFHECSTKQE